VLRRAVELGVNHIDTAAFYFSPLRSANELINSALAPYPGRHHQHRQRSDLPAVWPHWPLTSAD
jgi:predicted aldo/keto reductase-like oxidoreductase